MNILLTNDDGIDSEGIIKLAQALRRGGKHAIFVLAPDSNRSGVSQSLSILFDPIKLTEVSKDNWICSGTPVDCVIAACLGGKPCKPDVIVSGINRGANVGSDILYSGTAAAARQGAMFNIPSVALSLDGKKNYCWDMACQYSADHLEEFINMWERDIFINVNIPNNAAGPDGIVRTWPARKNYHDTISSFKGPRGSDWCFLNPGNETADDEKGTDWDAVSRNLVSVSPVYIHPVVHRQFCSEAPDHAAAGRRV